MRRFLISLFVLISIAARSQNSKLDVIQLGPELKSLRAVEWPYDIPFYLTVPIDADVVSMTMNYRIEDSNLRKKGWISFPHNKVAKDKKDGFLETPIPSDKDIFDKTRYSFLVPGLHPNIKYNFKFEVIKKVSLDAKLVTEMREKLAAELNRFFESRRNTAISGDDLKKEDTVLSKIVTSYFPGKDLRFKKNSKTNFSYKAFDLSPAVNLALAQSDDFEEANNTFKSASQNMRKEFDTARKKILSDIDSIQSGKLKMNRYSKEVLALPFNPGLKEFAGYSLLDGLKLLRQMSLPTSKDLKLIMEDTFRITNNSFARTGGKRHAETILFVASLLQELSNGVLRDTVKGIEVARFAYLKAMETWLTEITDNIPIMIKAEAEMDRVKELLPDILANIVQFESYEAVILPMVDVVSENTPYVSAEGGIAYIGPFESVARYSGANIYFSPINKKASMGKLRFGYRMLKMLSLQVGVMTHFGDRPVNTKSLIGGNSDLSLGIGLRLNRIIKINAGIVSYKTNADNAISNDYKLKGAGFFSIGLDVNILKAFGKVGTLLNL